MPSDIFRDMVKKAGEAGILMVSSVGNSGEEKQGTVEYPANYPEVIGVASIDENMEHSTFSNTGKAAVLVTPPPTSQPPLRFSGQKIRERLGKISAS